MAGTIRQPSRTNPGFPDWGVPVTRSRPAVPVVPLIAVIVGAGAAGALAGPVAAVATALALSALFVLAIRSIPAAVLRRERAARAGRDDAPRLFNLIEGMSGDLGITPPEVWISPGPPNAVALHVSKPIVCIRRNVVEDFTRTELEGAVAFLLTGIATKAARMATLPRWLFPGRGRPDPAALDVYTSSVTRYPPALAAALSKCSPADPPGLWLDHGDPERRAAALLDL